MTSTNSQAIGLAEMEDVIDNALPGIGEACRKRLCQRLDDIGVISIKDLEYVEESDISNFLKPIQLRKFLRFCHETIPNSSIQTFVPNPVQATQNNPSSVETLESTSVQATQNYPSPNSSTLSIEPSSFQIQQSSSTMPALDSAFKMQPKLCSPIHTLDSSSFQIMEHDNFNVDSLVKSPKSSTFQSQPNHSLPSSSVQSEDSSSNQMQLNLSMLDSSLIDGNIHITSTFSLNEKLNESWADNFLIDFNLIPREIFEASHKNEPPPKPHVNQMVRNLVIQIMNLHPNPGRKHVRTIANHVVSKFPNLFEDRIVDRELVTGSQLLMKKLENGIENRKRSSIFLEKNFGGERKRKTLRNSYGCVNWQPAEFPAGEYRQTQKEHQLWLQSEYKKMKRDELKIEHLMDRTYTSQRHFINHSKKSIISVKEEWPFLLDSKYLLQHAENLLGKNISKTFESAFPIVGKCIWNFINVNQRNDRVKKCLIKIRKEVESVGNFSPEIIGAIPLLMAYFEEDETLLIRENVDLDDCVSSTEILTPHITTFGTKIYQAKEFTVVIEGHGTTYTNCFFTALTCVFAAYFVFNIDYNIGTAHTMEFIQRCFADINPEKGTKVAKVAGRKQFNISSKVLKLINNLKIYETSKKT